MEPREKLVFTSDWVTHVTPHWEHHLAHLAGLPNVVGLEIGTFEGRSALWWLEHMLTGADSRLIAIEPWRERLEPNLAILREMGYGEDRLEVLFERSQSALRRLSVACDFVYIDGGKDADEFLTNAVLAWPLLKPGGILVFDDYLWNWTSPEHGPYCAHPPRIGIDAFLTAFAGQFDDLHSGWQRIVRKKP